MTYTRPASPLNPADEKMYAILTHVLGIFFSFIPSLITFLVFKDRGPFLRQHSVAALNFQITMAIAYAVGWILTAILIGGFIVAAAGILTLIFSILAAVAASQGRPYTYPLSIAFIK
ncbi:DUF4870 domain-containing protein [Gryllotalpicola sp.]|uniref:DUF4870 domain-containing protein n=1 Tax=Gryllotalpicola sp. TaxID=1932787 RepID=UPI00261007F9|nr:DUF4870 domain-containing protein [Gryllotalpicola sp.]